MQKHRILGAALVFCSIAFAESQYEQEKLPRKKISVCGKNYLAWVPKTRAEHARGLMNFRELKKTEAMLFLYEEEKILRFWMKNVPYDLDIAFFDKNKKLVSYTQMKATSPLMKEGSLPSYASEAPAMYAVEVKAGMLQKLPDKCRLVF